MYTGICVYVCVCVCIVYFASSGQVRSGATSEHIITKSQSNRRILQASKQASERLS